MNRNDTLKPLPLLNVFMSKSQVFAPTRVSGIVIPDLLLPGRGRTVGLLSPSAFLLLIVLAFLLTGSQPATAENQKKPTQQPYIIDDHVYRPVPSADGYKETGIASWYGPDFNGHPTSNGEVYDMYGQTAAHKLLPMNTKLDLVDNGTAKVQVTALGQDDNSSDKGVENGPNINYNLGEFYVQIGAFGQKNNAVKLQKRFSDTGHATIIQEFFSQKSILYRVCVYAGQELRGAYKVEDALHKHGWREAFLVAR